MSLAEFLIKKLQIFFCLTTLITAAHLIIGVAVDPNAVLDYTAYSSPLIFAALCTIPSFIMYSKNELSVKQTIIRKLIQLILIEGIVVLLVYLSPDMNTDSAKIVVMLIFVVLVIYVSVNLLLYLQNFLDAKKLTSDLIKLQGK